MPMRSRIVLWYSLRLSRRRTARFSRATSSARTVCWVIQSTTAATCCGVGCFFVLGGHLVGVEDVDDFAPAVAGGGVGEVVREAVGCDGEVSFELGPGVALRAVGFEERGDDGVVAAGVGGPGGRGLVLGADAIRARDRPERSQTHKENSAERGAHERPMRRRRSGTRVWIIRSGGRPTPQVRRSNHILAGTTAIAQTQRATAAGVKGATPPCRRRHFHEEPWDTTDVPFVAPAWRTPSTYTAGFAIPAGW